MSRLMLTEMVIVKYKAVMLTNAKGKRRKWGPDEFSDLPVSRQRKWQLRMQKENKCPECARPMGETGCPVHHFHRRRGKFRTTWRVMGPCVANMLKAGMTIPEIEKEMNTTRKRIYALARKYNVGCTEHHLPHGRGLRSRKYDNLNLRIFLKESLNEKGSPVIQTPTKSGNA